ncbi:uncharacterized protein LOC143065236 [Mytilus galloprovincialis]|uniref:uncharacterized protein LOC143065236 n=1 Tax=Mytilus galloprovincialis TaxID=29158 RepID=UPI003F7B7C62
MGTKSDEIVTMMRGNKSSIPSIIGTVTVFLILLFIYLNYTSSSEAQLSMKSLMPLYPYTRRKLIKHIDFKPDTFKQTVDPHFDFRRTTQELIDQQSSMYDKQMISIIRNYIIYQPTLEGYRLDNKYQFDVSGGQSAAVDNILRFKKDGFYVECCTTDGEKDSTSLFFERVRKWNGLVISPEPEKFTALQMKHRKAAIMNSCLSDSEHPVKKTITVKDKQTEIHCYPLYSIMAALERRTIDLFALDVGGIDELSIVKAIPFNKINIEILTVRFRGEIRHYKSEIQLYLESIGYDTVLKLIKEDDDSVHHLILKRRGSWITSIVFCVILTSVVSLFIYLYCKKRKSTISL